MKQKFSELPEGTKFIFADKEYQKIKKLKISCCKSINARGVVNNADTLFIDAKIEVQVVNDKPE
jgi:hypothetical protein